MQFFKVKTVEETFSLIKEHTFSIEETEICQLEDALHRVLARPIVAPENVPGFDRSTVDGYAVFSKDTYGSTESMPGFLNVCGEVLLWPLGAGKLLMCLPAACFLKGATVC